LKDHENDCRGDGVGGVEYKNKEEGNKEKEAVSV
jgi:hypothetical protein